MHTAASTGAAPVPFAGEPGQGRSAEPDRTPSVHSQGSSRGGPSPPVSQPLTQAATQSRLLRALLQPPPPPPGMSVPSSAERLPGVSSQPHVRRPTATPMPVPLSTAHSQPAGEQPLVTGGAGTAAAVMFGPWVSGRASPSHGPALSLPPLPRAASASSGGALGPGQSARGGSETPLPLFLSVARQQQPQEPHLGGQDRQSRQQSDRGRMEGGPLTAGVPAAGDARVTGGAGGADYGDGPGGNGQRGEGERGREGEGGGEDDGEGEGEVLAASQGSGSGSEDGGGGDEGVSV